MRSMTTASHVAPVLADGDVATTGSAESNSGDTGAATGTGTAAAGDGGDGVGAGA